MQHLDDRDVFRQLRSEIVLPARDSGAAVWLAGISLGGLIALDYASSYPGELDGLCLLAPYLGNRMLINEIAAASGLANWRPGELAESDAERRIWRYIKTRVDSRPVLLGYGRDDRFCAAHDMLAAALPRNWVDVVDGGHEWVRVADALGDFFGFALLMSQRETARCWKPPRLLVASAAVHLGAAAALIARPRAWPWALGALLANHVVLAAAGLWPRSQLLGANWTRLPAMRHSQRGRRHYHR